MKYCFFAGALVLARVGCADVKSVSEPLALDGKLDDAVWAQADWETGFQRFNNTKKKSREPVAQTEFALLADADALYVGVRAGQPKMDEFKAREPSSVFYSENVEFYLIPDGGMFEFYQFVIAFDGRQHAVFWSEGGNIRPDPFGPVWESKAVETPEGWTAEARIPLSAFYMTRGSAWQTAWKVNVGRSYRDREQHEFSSWIDGGSYRDFKNYRTVKGFPVRRAEEDVWIKSVVANVKGPEGGHVVGTLDFVINVAKGGAFTLESDFTAPKKVSLKTGDNTITLDATFPENGRHQLPITLSRNEGTGVCKRTYPVLVDYQPIRLKFTLPSYRGNFYPGQKADRVEGRVVSAVEGAVTLTLEGPGFGRKEQTLAADGTFAFDTTGFTEGTAILTVRAGGETLTRKVRKLAPLGEGHHVSWVENGNLVVDGKPIVRRNMYAEYYRGGEAFRRRYDADDLHMTKGVKAIGTLEPNRLIKGLEQKEAVHDTKPCDELFAKVDAVIERAMSGSGTYYYISDEPECRSVSPVYLRYIYDYVCDKDPYHVILSCTRDGERYIDCADWFETHPYINAHFADGKRVYGRQFNELGDYVSAFRPEKHPDKCIGGTLTCFCYSQGDYPTFTEYVANAWCEFLRGAKTLYPFAWYSMGDRASLYEGTRYVFSSAEALEPVLLHGRRQTLVKTPEYEAALWTMPDGEKMFCVQNFRNEPTKAKVPGISGIFTEFRGTRKFDIPLSTSACDFDLVALESLVATTKRYDAGLPSFAETQAKIDALERERLGRPNQLLDRYPDIEVATPAKGTSGRTMFDGIRDVLAWSCRGKNGFYEMSFPKFVPEFSEVTVYGCNIEGMRVKVCEGGEWKELVPVSTDKDEFRLRQVFDRTYSTVKMRIEFPKDKVEVYEIELPGRPRERKAASADDLLQKKTTDFWVKSIPPGASSNIFWRVERTEGQKYLSFDFREPKKCVDGKYTSWGLSLEKTGGHLCGNVAKPLAGLYTLRLPEYRGKPRKDVLLIRNRNLELDVGDIICSREQPKNAVEFVEEGGKWTVRLSLAERCADVSCEMLCDHGRGPRTFDADGKSAFDLKPTDGSCTVWTGEMPIPQNGLKRDKNGRLPRPFVKVTVLGGAIDRPILTWLDR